jgi:hypothetical protein
VSRSVTISIRAGTLIPGTVLLLLAVHLARRAAVRRYADGYVDGTIQRAESR